MRIKHNRKYRIFRLLTLDPPSSLLQHNAQSAPWVYGMNKRVRRCVAYLVVHLLAVWQARVWILARPKVVRQ
jgi:hypothetical protein